MQLTAADYFEIYDLYAAYAIALDTGDGAARVATFTPDGTMSSYLSDHVPYHMDRMLEATNRYERKERPTGGHLQASIHIVPTAEGASATCYALIGGGTKNADGDDVWLPAFYTDTLVKTADGWRFKTRDVFVGAPGDATY